MDKIASNHRSFGNLVQRRLTFKCSLNNKWKVISLNQEKKAPNYRHTFTKIVPSLLKFKISNKGEYIDDEYDNGKSQFFIF